MVIPNVFYTPEITMNGLSMERLENQDYMVTRKHNRCIVRYMFDEKKDTVDMEEETGMDCEKSSRMIEEHNKYLEEYFDSIDPKEKCSLIKGMEDLKIEKKDFYDYVDDQYLSMNMTLYAMKVNTFPRFISFLDLIKINKLVYENWEVLGKKFMEMIQWFYLGYLGQDALGELPPVIESEIARLLGLTQEDRDAIKECYKEYIGMVKVYYEEVKRSRQVRPGIVVGLEAPQAFARTSAEVEESPNGTQDGIAEDGVKTEESNADRTTNNDASSDDSLVIIT
nr:ARID DNA-binding domain-containing protein [Tanacetum cinerariifolium]